MTSSSPLASATASATRYAYPLPPTAPRPPSYCTARTQSRRPPHSTHTHTHTHTRSRQRPHAHMNACGRSSAPGRRRRRHGRVRRRRGPHTLHAHAAPETATHLRGAAAVSCIPHPPPRGSYRCGCDAREGGHGPARALRIHAGDNEWHGRQRRGCNAAVRAPPNAARGRHAHPLRGAAASGGATCGASSRDTGAAVARGASTAHRSS